MRRYSPGHSLPPLESIRGTAAFLEHELSTNITTYLCGSALPSIRLSKFITITENLYCFGYHIKHVVYSRSMSCYSRRKEYQKRGKWRTINIMERSLLRHFEEGSSETGVLGRYKGSYLPNVPHQATSVRWARVYQTFYCNFSFEVNIREFDFSESSQRTDIRDSRGKTYV